MEIGYRLHKACSRNYLETLALATHALDHACSVSQDFLAVFTTAINFFFLCGLRAAERVVLLVVAATYLLGEISS